jgi:Tat protein translocase TatB subunit
VFFLILESLGSTELVFILVMALVFFGPRKLPQLSRTMGKHLAEFRRASEDFKRTWDREVTLEEVGGQTSAPTQVLQTESSTWDDNLQGQQLSPPTIEAIAADRVVPRQVSDSRGSVAITSSDENEFTSVTEATAAIDQPEPSRKRDWL